MTDVCFQDLASLLKTLCDAVGGSPDVMTDVCFQDLASLLKALCDAVGGSPDVMTDVRVFSGPGQPVKGAV